MAQTKDLEEHLLSYLPKNQESQMHAVVTTTTTQEQLPPITHFLIFLYYLDHCWVDTFRARPPAFRDLNWICPVQGTLNISSPSSWFLGTLTQMQVRSTKYSFHIWKNTANRCWCSSGCIKASMSRCLLYPFSFFSFCSWLLLLSFLSSRCLLSLHFLFYIQRHLGILTWNS